MAADTAQKRFSAMNIGSPWRGLMVVPTGTIGADQRAAAMYLYSGIPLDAGVIVTPAIFFTATLDGKAAEAVGLPGFAAQAIGLDGKAAESVTLDAVDN